MELLQSLFSVNTILFVVLDYPLSLVELLGTLFGLWSVLLAARARVWNYPIGILNSIFFFASFYQVQLYADMLLQVYFIGMSVYGWWHWVNPPQNARTETNELTMTRSETSFLVVLVGGVLLATVLFGWLLQHIHTIFPLAFPTPAAYPYFDAFVMMLSITAMFLLARKKWENWLFWIAADVVSIVLFWVKGLQLISLEYVVFLAIASYGCWWWAKKLDLTKKA
jgi:nicotinamide mononucleotide transporter